MPCIEALSAGGYEIIYYNTVRFEPEGAVGFRFRAYPDHPGGYSADSIGADTSYFEFGGMLAETAEQLMDFLQGEIERERPDLILHSHLALWGKLVAQCHGLPAISLFTTFVLDQRIMLPFLRKEPAGGSGFVNVPGAMDFYRRLKMLHTRLSLRSAPDIWDVYVNKEALNISFIPDCFQPAPELLNGSYHFAGFQDTTIRAAAAKDLIYMSMGTIFNKGLALFSLAIKVLSRFGNPCLLSVGPQTDLRELGEAPPNIRIVRNIDQKEVLQKAAVFITHGGMASVQEAIYTQTPMVVIPQIPEQKMTADKIASFGLGVRLAAAEVSEETLASAVRQILKNQVVYAHNLRRMIARTPALPAASYAFTLIDDFFLNRDRQIKISRS